MSERDEGRLICPSTGLSLPLIGRGVGIFCGQLRLIRIYLETLAGGMGIGVGRSVPVLLP